MASTAQQDADIRRPDLDLDLDLDLIQHTATHRIGATPARPAPLGRDDARRRRLPARRAAARRTRAHPAAARPRVRRAQLRRAMLRAAAARDPRRRALPRRGRVRARRAARAGALPRRVPGGDGRAGAARRRRPLRDARRRRAAGRGLGHHAAGLVRAGRAHRRRGGVAVLAGAGRVRAGDARVHGRVRGVGEDALRSRHQTAPSEAAAAAETGELRDGNTVCVGGRAVESVSQHVCPALHKTHLQGSYPPTCLRSTRIQCLKWQRGGKEGRYCVAH